MRDEEQGTLELIAEEVLQPDDGFGVQMVRRLIEEQQVRLGNERTGEGHATLLTAGQSTHKAIRCGHTEFIHRRGDHVLDVPAIAQIDLVQEFMLLITLHITGFIA